MKRPRRHCAACGIEIARGNCCGVCKPKPHRPYPRKKVVLRKAAQKKLAVSRYMPGRYDVMQQKWITEGVTEHEDDTT